MSVKELFTVELDDMEMKEVLEGLIDLLHNTGEEVDQWLYDQHAEVCGRILEQQKG